MSYYLFGLYPFFLRNADGRLSSQSPMAQTAGSSFLEWICVASSTFHRTTGRVWLGGNQTGPDLRTSTFWRLVFFTPVAVLNYPCYDFFSLLYQVRSIYEHVTYIKFRKDISRPILKSKECLKIEEATKDENIFTSTSWRILHCKKRAQFHHSVKAKFGMQLFIRSWDVTVTLMP